MHYDLQQSTKFIYQSSKSTSLNPEATIPSVESPHPFSLDTLPPDAATSALQAGEDYIASEGVEKYLMDRGLDVTSGSPFVSIPPNTVVQTSSCQTLFDEIRAGQEIRLSGSKLLAGKFNWYDEELDRLLILAV
jgi:hypothetical protein